MTFFMLVAVVYCSLLLVVNGQYVFPDKTTLVTAVTAWISDESTATSTYGDINTWDVSAVTDMSEVFKSKGTFNSDISGWDVSSVTIMENMFYGASAFNGDISGWDVSSVTTVFAMFHFASVFNQQLCWDVTGKVGATSMFSGTNGASTIVCAPSSAPTSQPTGQPTALPTGQPSCQPTSQPTSQPTGQPTKDMSFKKHFKDTLDDVASDAKGSLKQIQYGMSYILKGIRHTLEPPFYNEDL